jgi:hypothetical protein
MGQLRGHTMRPSDGQPPGRPGVGRQNGVFGIFSYYSLVIFFLNVVPLITELTFFSFPKICSPELQDF